jgi:transcriptional regulator with XRE-family HTH domain
VQSTLAETLIKARERAGLSLRDVERATGVRNAHLSQLEHGRIGRPEPGLLFELTTVYDLDYPTLLALAGHTPPEGAKRDRALTAAAVRAVGELAPEQQAKTLDFIARLRRHGAPRTASPGAFGRERIEMMADQALQLSGATGEVPTPLEKVARVVGVEAWRPIAELPDAMLPNDRPMLRADVLGAAVFGAREIYVNLEQMGRRVRFTQAHEIAHLLLPWHEHHVLVDDEQRLFIGTDEEIEEEANWAAAHLIFQGKRFFARAAEKPASLTTPMELADKYDASMHATIRYYAEHHPDQVAVLIAGRYPQYDGTLPIWRSIQSAPFAAEFGAFGDHVGSLVIDADSGTFGRLARLALQRTSPDPPRDTVTLTDLHGDGRRFVVEAFFNGYSVFVFVARLGATRARARASGK